MGLAFNSLVDPNPEFMLDVDGPMNMGSGFGRSAAAALLLLCVILYGIYR